MVMEAWIGVPGTSSYAVRHRSPTAISNGGRKYPHCHRKQRKRAASTNQRDHRRSDHDDDQPDCGQGRQNRPNAQEPGKDQADRAQCLGHTDKAYEQSRQRYRSFEHFQRQNQLYPARPEKEQREQPLYGPKRIVRTHFHNCDFAVEIAS